MTPERYQELRRSFEQLLALGPQERAQALVEISRRDRAFGTELARLLTEQGRATALLDRSPLEVFGLGNEQRRQLGPYSIEREIGSGGMGVVYAAMRMDGSFRKRVAIKILRRDLNSRSFLARFGRERQILARLEHPHIASILDGGETPEGDPYFVMDYVDGVPITRYAEAHGLTIAQRLDLFLQVCDAVQYAHRNLTVHRDLKPGNILVTEAGAVKLLDFGVAKLMEPEAATAADAPATEALFTPAYTSPEQIRREPASTSGDIFQLGILLYELLAGEHPFERKGRLPHEVMRAICEDDPPAPSSVARRDCRQIRGELDAIILTTLRKQPAWRYPSVEQLADDIGRYRQGWPVLATGNSLPYRLRKFARRQWLALAAMAALILLLIGGILVTARQARLADMARAQAERERAAAEGQRRLAEQAQLFATGQRMLAEARTKEAESERQRAQERYREVRTLASSLLFDLYDGVRDLAGSATARRLIVAKAQHQLELLNADAGEDIGLQRDLAASYERMGELRVDPHRPDKNDAAAAVEAYRHAVSLRRRIAGSAGALPRDQSDLALSLAKLGDGEFLAGDTRQALADYQNAHSMAQRLLRSQPADPSMPRALGTVDERLCIVLLAAGDNAGAMESCREGIATLSPLARTLTGNVEVQRLIATTQASYANALRLSGKPRDAATQAGLALESLEKLQALAPSNAEYRRLAASTETILAGSLAASGDIPASLDAFGRAIRSMDIAVEIDPSDLGSPLRLAGTLLAFSRQLGQGAEKIRAHDAARQALQLLEQTSQKPGAGAVEWNEYADALLKVDWPDLRAPAKALALAGNAVASSQRQNPFFLDTLAWAYFRTGNTPKAVETEREALRLLPGDAKGGLHDELAHGLESFLAGAVK
jgi:tetratricopeptide (TPR) repeat protein/tRNA A-37 threonylcarbamoyl transferase component Bud32